MNPFMRPANASDETIIELSADKKAVALHAASSASDALRFMHEMITNDDLPVSMRFSCIGVADAELNRLKLATGAKSDEEQAAELNANQLRQANIEIHRLRNEMGKAVSIEQINLGLYPLQQLVYDWWKAFGFLSMEGAFDCWSSGGRYKARLSCYLDRYGCSVADDAPVTSMAAKRRTLEQLAEVIDIENSHGDDVMVLDTERSRLWIVEQLKERFPGVQIHEWKSHGTEKNHIGKLREIHVGIPIEDIPLKSEAELSEQDSTASAG